MVRYDGHRVSQATVLRLLRDEGLILEANYQRERRELAANRRAAFATAPTGPNQVWQLDNSRVRDHVRWDLADRRLPGLLEQVRAPVPHLPDREPARRDRRGRARPGRGCRAGRSAAARPRPGRPARQRPAPRDDRDRQRRAVPVLPVRGVHRHPPRASPRPHPSAHPRPERLTRTRLRLPEVRTAVPRGDPRRDRPGRPRRALPDRVQHRPTPREPVLEPPNRGPPRLRRPEDPQLPRARKPAICLTRARSTCWCVRRPTGGAGRQAGGVHEDVAFDAVDLLGAVEAARSGHGHGLDGGGVHDRGGGLRLPACAGPRFFAQHPQQARPQAGLRPPGEVFVGCGPGDGEVVRARPPGGAGAGDVEQHVDVLAPPCLGARWREYVNVLLYITRTGTPWRARPHDFTVTWSAAHKHFTRWTKTGLWSRLLRVLREETRTRAGRKPKPTAAIVDSSSVKAMSVAGPRGFDGAKKIDGIKRHILVDTTGLSSSPAGGSSNAPTGGSTTTDASCASTRPPSPPTKASSCSPRSDYCSAASTTGSCSTRSRVDAQWWDGRHATTKETRPCASDCSPAVATARGSTRPSEPSSSTASARTVTRSSASGTAGRASSTVTCSPSTVNRSVTCCPSVGPCWVPRGTTRMRTRAASRQSWRRSRPSGSRP